MNRAASRLDWRDVAIVAIKAVHSGVFLLNATSVLHIFWVGMLNRRSRWTRVALVAALGESLVFVANRGRCPLTRLVEAMGAESGRVSDIFLPRWFADRIPLVFGLIRLDVGRLRTAFSPHAPMRLVSAALVVMGILTAVLWLGQDVLALLAGGVPSDVTEAGLLTNPVHVLDLGLVLPAAVLTGVLLARRRPWGFVLGRISW